MKNYIQKSLMLSAIIYIVVTLISFLCFEYRAEMTLNFLILFISFLSMGIHYVTLRLFHDSFLKEIVCKYVLVETMVPTTLPFNIVCIILRKISS